MKQQKTKSQSSNTLRKFSFSDMWSDFKCSRLTLKMQNNIFNN